MHAYGFDSGIYEFGFSDPMLMESLYRSPAYLAARTGMGAAYYDDDDGAPPRSPKKPGSPPSHRHDGTSPLPFGMDWSPPPRKWDGPASVWPHDPHSGWSYCVTIPSWTVLPNSGASDPAVFYRVQVGIQTPKGITTTRGTLRRFNDFLKLYSDLKTAFPKKKLPPAPPKGLLKRKNKTLLEERRCSLEDWMEKLLSDIDLSRCAPVAIFLELEAAAISSFYESNQHSSDLNYTPDGMVSSESQSNSDASLAGKSPTLGSDNGDNSVSGSSDLGTPGIQRDSYPERGLNNIKYDQEKFSKDEICASDKDETESLSGSRDHKLGSHVSLSTESLRSDIGSVGDGEISNMRVEKSLGDNTADVPDNTEIQRTMEMLAESDLEFPRDLIVALPLEERNKLNRVLITMQRRLGTAKTDMEDLIARLDQELAVRQYLTTKVKDLEADLETTKQSSKENLQQAILAEKERYTQTQWDVEELRRQCIEIGLKLKSEQDEKVQIESTRASISQENEMLRKELSSAKEQIENMRKDHDDLESKSKANVKLLVKEVKSLRSSQSELKQELGKLMKEKTEVERILHKEKERREHTSAANAKLLHECEILRNRLEESSVNFLEEEDKLIMDASSPSDAVDLLMTSDNRIGLLIAEAQLLAQDIDVSAAARGNDSDNTATRSDDELRKMLTDVFIDNARLRKQVNTVIRCALNTPDKSLEDEEEEKEENETPASRSSIVFGRLVEG